MHGPDLIMGAYSETVYIEVLEMFKVKQFVPARVMDICATQLVWCLTYKPAIEIRGAGLACMVLVSVSSTDAA